MNQHNETERRIKVATVHALAKHGYADLSIKRIEEQLGQSSSLLYHYFDDKDDLVLSALDLVGEQFDKRQEHSSPSAPEDDLIQLLEAVFYPPPAHEDGFFEMESGDFEDALIHICFELWAQATRSERYRAKITELENKFIAEIKRLLRSGVETEQFRETDLNETAESVYALLLHGLHTRTVVDRDNALETTRKNLYRFLDRELATDLRADD